MPTGAPLGLVDRADGGGGGGGGVLVDGPQRPPVRSAFTGVPTDLGADLLQAAELFGQQLQAFLAAAASLVPPGAEIDHYTLDDELLRIQHG